MILKKRVEWHGKKQSLFRKEKIHSVGELFIPYSKREKSGSILRNLIFIRNFFYSVIVIFMNQMITLDISPPTLQRRSLIPILGPAHKDPQYLSHNSRCLDLFLQHNLLTQHRFHYEFR
jgi:hypothetical protein